MSGLFDARTRIHDKAERSPAFDGKHFGDLARAKFLGATDALYDAGDVLWTVSKGLSPDTGVAKVYIYALLQALVVQQDSVAELCKCLGLNLDVTKDPSVEKVRTLRNRLVGHPARAAIGLQKSRPSAGILSGRANDPMRLQGAIYYDDGFENVDVGIAELIELNERGLLPYLSAAEAAVDERIRAYDRGEL
ncbi:MAG: hypothetical protein GC145_08415 [Caulobacter sp.]|nr:hypothetical protein [Caulobacter sp.]